MEPKTDRVLRGGSWNNNAENCRSANRNRNTPTNRNNNNGFRVALHFRMLENTCPGIAWLTGPASVVTEVQVPFLSRRSLPMRVRRPNQSCAAGEWGR